MQRELKWLLIGSLCAFGLGACLEGPEYRDQEPDAAIPRSGSDSGSDSGYDPNDPDSGATYVATFDWFTENQAQSLYFPLGSQLKSFGRGIDSEATDRIAFQEVVYVSNEEDFKQALIADNTVMGRQIRLMDKIIVTQPLKVSGHIKISSETNGGLEFTEAGSFEIHPKNTDLLNSAPASCDLAKLPDPDLANATVLKLAIQASGLNLTGPGPLHLIHDRRIQPTINLAVSGKSLLVGSQMSFKPTSSGLRNARLALEAIPPVFKTDFVELTLPPSSNVFVDRDHSTIDIEDPKDNPMKWGPYCANLLANIRYSTRTFNAARVACTSGQWIELIHQYASCGGLQ